MSAIGRLLPVETANGAYQMRRDEALLRECAANRGISPPAKWPAAGKAMNGLLSQQKHYQTRHPERSEERAESKDADRGLKAPAEWPSASMPLKGHFGQHGSDLDSPYKGYQAEGPNAGGFIPRSPYPVLRFYHWDPPCISLGRNQDLDNPRHGFIDQAEAERLGVDIVRRPSGGRAILHYHDLTYALVMPAPSDDVSASHRTIAAGLAAGLRLLGLSVDDGLTLMPPGRNPADCFTAVAGADLQATGRKVMGSAQRRTGGALLEHGTLYLESPEPLYSRVFGQPFGGSVTALDEALGRGVTFDEVANALTRGLEAALGVEFV